MNDVAFHKCDVIIMIICNGLAVSRKVVTSHMYDVINMTSKYDHDRCHMYDVINMTSKL